MGVKYLRGSLHKYASNGISVQKLSKYEGKKVAIDISSYLYECKGKGNLAKEVFYFISELLKYKLEIIAVFDGKPKEIKKKEIKRRGEEKSKAWEEFKKLKQESKKMNKEESNNLIQKMNYLKKKCMRISWEDIDIVKNILSFLGCSYIESPNEADEVCAKLALGNLVDIIISEDSDMFVYGCPIIIREFNFNKQEAKEYDMTKILNHLRLNLDDFQQICIFLACDYNKSSKFIFSEILKLFNEYKKKNVEQNFYDWISMYLPQIPTYLEYSSILSQYKIDNSFVLPKIKKDVFNTNINYSILNNYNYKPINV